MAVALVQSNQAFPSASCAFSSNVTAGNLLIVLFSGNGTNNNAPTNSGAALTWTKINSSLPTSRIAPGTPVMCYGWWAVADSTRALTVTVPSITDVGVVVAEFSGQHATPIHAFTKTDTPGASTTPTIPGPTGTTVTSMIVAYFGDESENASSPTPGTGYVDLKTTDNHVHLSIYKADAPAGDYGPYVNYGTTATTWNGFAFAIEPAATVPDNTEPATDGGRRRP